MSGERFARVLATVLFAGLVVAGCFHLDGFLYNQPLQSTQYKLGSFDDPALPDVNAFVPDSAIDNNEQVTFVSDGYILYGYWLKHAVTPQTTMLYCHGNYKDLDNEWTRAKLFYAHGFDVLIFDYRGLGMSQGERSISALGADGTAAVSYLIDKGVPVARLLVYGHSLGSVPAIYVASTYPGIDGAQGLVLEAPIGSTELFVQDATDLPVPGDALSGEPVDNVKQIEGVHIPLFWLQGARDGLIRWDTHGIALYDHYGGTTKYRLLVPEADHANIEQTLQRLYGGARYSIYLGLFDQFLAGQAPTL